jgi:hypothetical protein
MNRTNDFQDKVLKYFVEEFAKHPSVLIVNQKSRISFKSGRFNFFILFLRKEMVTLHVNLRNVNDEGSFSNFSPNCFNRAKRYVELEISRQEDVDKQIELLKREIEKVKTS